MNITQVWRLTRKFLWRNLRKGELSLLMLSLVVATATITSVTVFTSRISNSINQEAATYLGADAKIRGSMPIPDEWRQEAQQRQIETADLMFFRAMAFAEAELTLVQVKAASKAYPLRGVLEIAHSLTDESELYDHGPNTGEIWLASRLFSTLNVDIGSTIKIGEKSLRVAGVIRKEPDSVQTAFGFSPRVIMHIDDVAATQAVQLGSRINYEWLLAGDKNNLQNLKDVLLSQLGEHHNWRDSKNGNRQVDNTMERAEQFLLLSSSLSLLLAGVAIALAVRRFIQRQTMTVAVLKTLGLTPKVIASLYVFLVSSVGLLTSLIGCLIGWFLHLIILYLLGNFIATDLASADPSSYMVAAFAVFITLIAFCISPLFELQKTQPSAILRDMGSQNISIFYSSLLGFGAVFFVLAFFSGDIKITFILFLGVLFLSVAVFLVTRFIIYLVSVSVNIKKQWWRIGLINIKRHQPMTSLQILIFSTVFMLVSVLLEIRTGLIERWENNIPERAPNHFIFNIFPSDLASVKQYFLENNVETSPYYPMSRGRIFMINDESLEDRVAKSDSRMNFERELNLTWSNQLGSDNKILQGVWWEQELTDSIAEKPMLASVEQEYAEGLGLNIGDTVQFSVAGNKFSAEIASIRSVEWDSMNPNFFIIFNQPFYQNLSANWITSFYVDAPQNSVFVTELLKRFPSVSVLELEQTLKQIQDIITKVSSAVEFILWLVLVSGLLILIISIQATLDTRRQESALYRALGAQRKLVRNTLLVEFSLVGLLSGLVAAIGAELILYIVQVRVFDLVFNFHPLLWFVMPIASAFLVGSAGYLSTRDVMNVSPLMIMREQ